MEAIGFRAEEFQPLGFIFGGLYRPLTLKVAGFWAEEVLGLCICRFFFRATVLRRLRLL